MRRERYGWDGIPRLSIALMSTCLLLAVACRPGVPVIDTNPGPTVQDGTISGSVKGPDGSAVGPNRLVQATSVETGQVFEARTSETGGYTMKVPPGRYRLQVQLNPGERLLQQPGEVRIDRSDLDAQRDFVISSGGGA